MCALIGNAAPAIPLAAFAADDSTITVEKNPGMDWEGETVDIGSSDSDWGDSDYYDTSWYTENEDADEYVLTDAADLAGLAYILSVESCSVSGRIVTSAQTMSDSRRVGGVVGNIQFVQGYKESALDECAFSGIMLGGFPVMGGVAGSVFNGQVTDCSNNGVIANQFCSEISYKPSSTAGVVAVCDAAASGCRNSGQVTAASGDAGGVFATAGETAYCAQISSCSNSATVNLEGEDEGTHSVGGVLAASISMRWRLRMPWRGKLTTGMMR